MAFKETRVLGWPYFNEHFDLKCPANIGKIKRTSLYPPDTPESLGRDLTSCAAAHGYLWENRHQRKSLKN